MYSVENTAVCLLQEYCVLNVQQIDKKNELHSNVEMGKRKNKSAEQSIRASNFPAPHHCTGNP